MTSLPYTAHDYITMTSLLYLVTNEAVGPCLRLEVPHHETGVHGACSQLLHVGVEGHAGYRISVALEVTL